LRGGGRRGNFGRRFTSRMMAYLNDIGAGRDERGGPADSVEGESRAGGACSLEARGEG